MTKRLVDIDDDLLEPARSLAGTRTIGETVDVALRRLVDQDTALRHVARLRHGGLGVQRVAAARRPRWTP